MTFLNLEYLYNQILLFFKSGLWWWVIESFRWLFSLLVPVLIVAIIYLVRRTTALRLGEKTKVVEKARAASFAASAAPRNEAWDRVQKYLASGNPAEWKLAVIEADNMLDEMLKGMNYPGENLGERLKQIEPSDFTNLQAAWDAHKVRNQIAHQSDFILTRHEVGRVISLYRQVFEEFKYI